MMSSMASLSVRSDGHALGTCYHCFFLFEELELMHYANSSVLAC